MQTTTTSFSRQTSRQVGTDRLLLTISGGYGLPLGVIATKIFTPNDGFQGSNVSISIGLVNQGTLPIYQVDLNNSYDSFLSIISSNSSYAAILNGGGHLNALLNANLTGTPGVYNSSSSAASLHLCRHKPDCNKHCRPSYDLPPSLTPISHIQLRKSRRDTIS